MSTPDTFVFNPNAQYLFKRAYTLNMAPPGTTAALQYGTEGPSPAPLRVKFDIDKNMIGSSNKSKIEIYNLSTQSRMAIKKGYVLQLNAGYNGLIEQLFVGNVVTPISKRKDADIITEIECGDGESSITFARLDKSYGAGVKLSDILQDVARAMGSATTYNPLATNAGIAVGIPDLVFNKGFVASGACRDSLDKLLKPQGLEWSIQNGNLNIIPITAYNGASAIIVSSDTGMIGVPSQNDFFTQFESLLNPKLVPGQLIKMESENTALNGFYKIRRSHFEGDSHDTKWQVSCECIPQAGVVQSLRAANGFNYDTAVS